MTMQCDHCAGTGVGSTVMVTGTSQADKVMTNTACPMCNGNGEVNVPDSWLPPLQNIP